MTDNPVFFFVSELIFLSMQNLYLHVFSIDLQVKFCLNSQKPVAIAENLRKEFQKNKSQRKCCKKGQKDEIKTAVRNASFAVDDGEVFGLLGPNGAGKTTVINMIVAEIGPTRGRVSCLYFHLQVVLIFGGIKKK